MQEAPITKEAAELMSKEILYIAWVDSATTHGWVASEDTDKVCGIGHVCTVGFLVRENEKEIILAMNGATDDHTSPHGDCIAIPKVCISERRKLSAWPVFAFGCNTKHADLMMENNLLRQRLDALCLTKFELTTQQELEDLRAIFKPVAESI